MQRGLFSFAANAARTSLARPALPAPMPRAQFLTGSRQLSMAPPVARPGTRAHSALRSLRANQGILGLVNPSALQVARALGSTPAVLADSKPGAAAPTAAPVAGVPYSSMSVGVPKETEAGEARVAAVPSTVQAMVKKGMTVFVESGAGAAANFTDDAYRQAGAVIVDSARALGADVVLKVRGAAARVGGPGRGAAVARARLVA